HRKNGDEAGDDRPEKEPVAPDVLPCDLDLAQEAKVLVLRGKAEEREAHVDHLPSQE
ncbi:hypothetical protein LTR16_012655, partial [Cryomyces antarcticus]